MRYSLDISDEGYVLGIGGNDNGELTQEEYQNIIRLFHSKPEAPDGYEYRLKDTLEWELAELPPAPTVYTQTSLEAMTNAELEQILYGFGITANMNKANMIRLILAAQEGGAG